MVRHVEVRRGAYHDSVTLMIAGRAVALLDGVRSALVGMGTDLNLELLAGMGFAAPDGPCGPNDLVIAFESRDASGMAGASAVLEEALSARGSAASAGTSGSSGPGFGADGDTVPARTIGSALRRSGGNLALISTPGPHAFVEAVDALESGASVVVFSDNVPVAQEIALKDLAASRGLLAMGPDCGTVVVGGVGLGFANVVRPGAVSLVAASGTGSQQVMALLDAAGVGVRHCLGVGGRDLSAAVAGRSTLAALNALDADAGTDAGTELIVLVSKTPDPDVEEFVREHARGLTTPVVFALLGDGHPDLTASVEAVLSRMGHPVPEAWPSWSGRKSGTPLPAPAGSALRGLFSGGTLCQEAAAIVGEPGRFTDFGDDRYTRGRPHPMIDQTLRLEALAALGDEPDVGVVLMDVVLGRGAHADPATELAPAVAATVERGVAVVVSLCGTAGDPQGLERQARVLAEAGADVFASNAEAARFAAHLTGSRP